MNFDVRNVVLGQKLTIWQLIFFFLNLQFPDDLNRFEDNLMYIHRYTHRYLHTIFSKIKKCKISNFWPKTANFTSKFIKIEFPNDSNRFEARTMYLHRYILTYIIYSLYCKIDKNVYMYVCIYLCIYLCLYISSCSNQL